MESRVGSLALNVRAAAGRLSDVRPAAEEFTVRVLRRCDEILEERAPGRVVLLRRLDLSLRLLDRALEHEGEIGAFAEEIAEALDRWARSADETPSGDPEVAVFEDEPTWLAAYLEARAAGRSEGAWRFEALETEGEPMRTFLDVERTTRSRELLSRLRRRGTLLSSLAALPEHVMKVLAEALGMTEDAARPAAGSAAEELPENVAACLHALPFSTPPPLARVAVAVAARDVLGPFAPEAEIAKLARAALARFFAARRGTEPAVAGHSAGHGRRLDDALAKDGAARDDWDAGIASEFGRLFFLLNPALELSIGEILWRACLPEGLVLARAAAALLGTAAAGDPAPELFGGARPGDPLPEVLADQQAEVSLTLLTALRDALPRRGLADLPQVGLRLVETPAGRLFVAAEHARPYVLFAFPANSPDGVRAALDAFLAAWPASAPAPRAARALAELDRRARVRPVKGEPPAVELLLAEGDSLPARALLTQIAGALGHLFSARTGLALPRQLAVPVRVLLTEETMEIRIPMEHLDLDIRRAGLDADPGWVPWLGRRVTITYEEDVALRDV